MVQQGSMGTVAAGDSCEATFVVPALSPMAGQAVEHGSTLALLLMEVLHGMPGVHRVHVDRAGARVYVAYRRGVLTADDLRTHLGRAGYVVDRAAAV